MQSTDVAPSILKSVVTNVIFIQIAFMNDWPPIDIVALDENTVSWLELSRPKNAETFKLICF